MYVDDPMILELVALLKAHGVRHAVVSPGSRHYPLVRSLEADADFHLYSVVDERSAGFFAIGLIRAVSAPVAVLTTSGTAAVNLGSAVADAYYQRLPLIAITADRLPQLLDQMEDQMVDQSHLFAGTIRARALMRPISGDIDHWYDNRVVNEALLAMTTNGTGPVHINIPVQVHTGLSYTVSALPAARVISHHTPTRWATDWADVTSRLSGKRVLIVWGQSDPLPDTARAALTYFCDRTDSLIAADHLSNLRHPATLARPFPSLRSPKAKQGALTPDIVITVGGTSFLIDEVRSLLRRREIEHWHVDAGGAVVDPFWQLTDIFQVDPTDFFTQAVIDQSPRADFPYRGVAAEISAATPPTRSAYGELSTIGRLLETIPRGSALHIANSAPMRMAHLFDIDPSITVLGNRGVNGIDGSMSATIGYAAATEDRLTYLIVGDLSFFYDLNSLGIRHLPPRLRILLVNNGGGALMHSSPVPINLAEQAAQHISAGHDHTSRGWVESLGITYLHASNADELDATLPLLTDEDYEGTIVLEVFTDKVSDITQLKDYHASNTAVGDSTYRKVRRRAGRTLRRLGLRG